MFIRIKAPRKISGKKPPSFRIKICAVQDETTPFEKLFLHKVKKFVGSIVPFFLFHLICCGALIIFLATSGYLLLIRQEGDKKIFLLPLILFGGFFFFLHQYYGRCCEKKGHKNIGDYILLITFYVVFSFLFGIVFMIYVFIPWWIPGYKGGFLLP